MIQSVGHLTCKRCESHTGWVSISIWLMLLIFSWVNSKVSLVGKAHTSLSHLQHIDLDYLATQTWT